MSRQAALVLKLILWIYLQLVDLSTKLYCNSFLRWQVARQATRQSSRNSFIWSNIRTSIETFGNIRLIISDVMNVTIS